MILACVNLTSSPLITTGKKGKVDKNASTEPVKYDETHLTEAFCAGLPAELARKVRCA
jgi:hypothetical protein